MTDTKRLVAYIEEDQHRRLRVLAANQGSKVTELVREALDLYLEAQDILADGDGYRLERVSVTHPSQGSEQA